jgi:putative addiction module component (TIGR02574 family)
MTDHTKQIDYSHLGNAERILLAQELWESVHPDCGDIPLSEAESKEIHRRWAAFEAGEMGTSSWPEVKRFLLNQ